MGYKKCKICKKNFFAIGNNKTCSLECQKNNKKIYGKNYFNNNKEKFHKYNISEKRKKYCRVYAKTEKRRAWDKTYEQNPKRIAWRRKYSKTKKVKEYTNRYARNRYRNDEIYRLRRNMSKRIAESVKLFNQNNNQIIKKPIFPFDMQELKTHLETNFIKTMNWKNQNTYWEIDHLIPLSWATNKYELYEIRWNINNLYPMKKTANRKKSNKFALVNNIKFYDKRSAMEYFKEIYLKPTYTQPL